ncbi:MAG: nucleotidyltransferase family protein [Microcystaceae cyanobacterium]
MFNRSTLPLNLPQKRLNEFCQRHHIYQLSLFGSILREDFCDRSDVDFLVWFKRGKTPGYVRLAGMELELSEIIGRKADLRTPNELSRYFRDQVLQEALTIYDERQARLVNTLSDKVNSLSTESKITLPYN